MEPNDLLRYLVQALEELNIPYAVVGSMASMYYGEARFTNDIDIVVQLTEDRVKELVSRFPEDEFYLSEDAVLWAIKHRSQFNVLHMESGLKCDMILPKNSELDIEQLKSRRTIRPVPDLAVSYASPEIVILHKMLAYQEGGSDKHLRDIASMMKIRRTEINSDYIANWSDRLGLREIWEMILSRLNHPNV